MGEPRLTKMDGARSDTGRSGERLALRAGSSAPPTSLTRARLQEDDWDDRCGLLPPEPPAPSHRYDSVMLALDQLQPTAPRRRYGSLAAPALGVAAEAALKRRLNASLSAVAGYVDAAGFIALFGMFPAHLTGELVSAAALSTHASGSAIGGRLLLALLFFFGVAGSVILARVLTRRGQPALAPQLVLLTVCLSWFCVLGCVRPPSAGALDWTTTATAGAAVLAMGVQNAMMRQALVGTLPTTVMTGNLTQLVTEIVDLCLGRLTVNPDAEQLHQSRRRLAVLGRAVGCFFGGALLGAWLTHIWGLVSVVVPTVISGVLALLALRAAQSAAAAG